TGLLIASAWISCAVGALGQLSVVSTSPPLNGRNADMFAPISVTFNRAVNRATFTSNTFWAFGRTSGTAVGTISFSNADQTVTLTPTRRFQAGEPVMVILSHDLRAADGSAMRQAGYSWQFW